MKSILTLLNDYRDTIFYFLWLVAAGVDLMVFDGKSFSNVWQLVQLRELFRVLSWAYNDHPKKYTHGMAAIGALYFSNCLGCVQVFGSHTVGDVFGWGFAFGLNVTLFLLINRFVIRHLGFRRICRLYALIYWRELFDWPRKQKPPGRRIEKGVEAVKRLMQNIVDAMPAPVPEAA